MKKFFTILVVALCATFATAQTDQHFWLNGKLMFGSQIAQTDSITFGSSEDLDTLHLILPRTVAIIQKETIYVEVHDTIYIERCPGEAGEGALSGEFSVSATEKVHFSQGNLQATYNGSSWSWSFAEHQYDYVGNAAANNAINGNGTVSANGTVDLFGWSTAATYYGIHNSNSNATYSGDFVDWGTNAITNGGNEADFWRTLTKDEWVYLFCGRENAATLFGLGSVNGVNGTILLPDNWVLPTGASFTASTAQGLAEQGDYYENSNENNFSHNTYTIEQWAIMESAGAVFLPAAGNRDGTDVYNVGSCGYYWLATPDDTGGAYYLYFDSRSLFPQGNYDRYYGRSVRLVR